MNEPKSEPEVHTTPEDELFDLCNLLLDRDFSEADRSRLESLVLQDPVARRRYVEFMHQNAALYADGGRLSDKPLAEILHSFPDELPAPITKVVAFPRWIFRAAAIAIVGLGVWWWSPSQSDPILATLVETNGARWENSSLPTNPGASLKQGRLRLAEGVARIAFQSGAEASLEGPAELEILTSNSCFLHSGALVAHVPERARGFSVGTANALLVDHGTDFGISTDTAGSAQVQVLLGEVELQHARSGEKLRLLTRESAAVAANRFSQMRPVEGEPDRYAFARNALDESGARSGRRVSLTTAGGNGDAAYVVSARSPLHRSDTLLLVKNPASTAYRRKAYLRFDLSTLRQQQIVEATLSLNFESTGFGFASLTGECTFVVYGVTEDQQDDWSSASLTWEGAPAFSLEAGTVNLEQATRLGSFTLPRGVVSGRYLIESPELAAFLNADVNRQATLIVVRETVQVSNDAAVHGFAGNHHPTLAPPTLRLLLKD